MPGGFQELVINPNERALSTDIMRLQRFKGRDVAEIFRAAIDSYAGTDDLDAGGLFSPVTTQNSPVAAEIMGGLLVSPQVGSLNLLVSAGVAFLYDPDAAPNSDESQYKLADDPGVTIAGTLVMTANTSGQTRIDVIECARSNIGGSGTDQVIETDNRDVYNTTTGLFSATTVNKVTDGRLQYRVRQGTPGAGFPGTVAGWLPLAVASVPNTTTTNDTITFWDVRPLVGDRAFQPFSKSKDLPHIDVKAVADGTGTYGAGHTALTGVFETTDVDFSTTPQTPGRYRLGGRIRRGTPGSDTALSPTVDGLDLGDTTNTDGSLSVSTPTAYVYVLSPFNLPRWARYTDAGTGVRKPRSPRGIILASATAPKHFWGGPSAPISLASCGFAGQTTQRGTCIMVLPAVGAGIPSSGVSDGRQQFSNALNGTPTSGTITGGGTLATFPLVDGTSHPAHAKALIAQVFLLLSVPNNSDYLDLLLQLRNGSGTLANVYEGRQAAMNSSGSTQTTSMAFTVRIPLVPGYPVASPPATRNLVASLGSNVASIITSASLTPLGWEL